MWLVGNKKAALAVYLGAQGFAVLQGDAVLHTHEGADAQSCVEALKSWLHSAGLRANVQVFLGASLCRPFLANMPAGLTPQEAERAWAAAASLRTGVSTDSRIWRDTAASTEKQIAAAVENALLTPLLLIGKQAGRGVRLVAIRPAWAEWLKLSLARDASASCVVLHETDSVTVLAGRNGHFELAATVLKTGDTLATQAAVDRLLMVADLSDKPPCQARLQLRRVRKPVANAGVLAPLLETVE